MAKPYFFAVLGSSLENTRGELSPMGVRGFLDMLRYDRAIVHKIEGGMFVLQTDSPPTEGRWLSFGIPIWCISRTDFETIDGTRREAGSLLSY